MEREISRKLTFNSRSLWPGITEITCQQSSIDALKYWRRRPPIYLHHIHPLHLHTDSTERLVSWIVKKVKRKSHFHLQFRQVGRWEHKLTTSVEDRVIKQSGIPNLRSSPNIVSVLSCKGQFFAGLSSVAQNISPWAAGSPPLSPDPRRLNRAEPKLLEALITFGITCAGERALDLGSSTGGWSQVLLDEGLEVTAVDPVAPDPSVLRHTLFTHKQMRAESFLQRTKTTYDLVVNDMVLWPAESARIMVQAAPHLGPEANAVMTLKVGCKKAYSNLDHALRILRRAYRIPRIKNLYHNGKEVTVWLKPHKHNLTK